MQIRNATADALYIELPEAIILTQDWSRPVNDLRAAVKELSRLISEPAAKALTPTASSHAPGTG